MVAVAASEPALVGSQEPRVSCVPDGEEHPRWREIVEFVAATGTVLDPWQLRVLWAAMLRRAGLWAAFAVAVCAPRQNGKNGILEMRELVGALLLGERLLIHSAHLADTSKEGFRRLDELLDANEWLSREVRHIWRTNGHEAIEFRNGNRIRFRTRTRGGGRGFSGSPVVFDEAMFLPEVSMGAILPVISAQPDPQVWYMGSAVDQAIHDDGRVFARVRERALEGKDDRLAFFEWSLEAESPDAVEAAQATDPAVWAQTNPALGIRISLDYVAAEYLEVDDRTFAVERLGVGDWPPTDRAPATVIPIADWDTLADPASSMLDPVAFTFDVSPDRSSASIGVSGRRPDGLLHVEVVEQGRGTGWLVDRMVELTGAHGFSSVSCDGAGPAASLIPGLEQEGVEVTPVSAGEYGQACGRLVDLVADGVEALREGRPAGVRHLGTGELRSAIKGAAKRPLGDAWAWSRKNSGVDITPLVTVTLAAWAAAAPAQTTSSWRAF